MTTLLSLGKVNRLAVACILYLASHLNAVAQNACTTTQQGMVGWWKLDTPFMGSTSDASGNNMHGQLTNASITGRGSIMASSMPSSSYLRVPGLTWKPNTFSVAWWVMPYATYRWNLTVRAQAGWGSFFFHTTETGGIYVGTDFANSLTVADLPANTVEINKWQHFVFTYANGKGSLFKNGILLASRNGMVAPNPWGGFTVGGNAAAGETTADGAFSDMRIYNRAITADEAAILSSGVACPTVPLAAASSTGDTEHNWAETIAYDNKGTEIGSSRQYADVHGRLIQSQVKDYSTSQVLAKQPVYDALGRAAITTLPAPINNSTFRLKNDFITSAATPSQKYGVSDFDANPNNPAPVAASTPGTLGWYYSSNNTLEPDVATTSYPYNRVESYADGTGEVKRATGPGDEMRAGKGRENKAGTFAVVSELNAYLAIRAKYFPNAGANPSTLKYHGVQSININSQNTTTIAVRDEADRPIMSALPNSSTTAWLASINNVSLSQERYSLLVNPSAVCQPSGFQSTSFHILAIDAPEPINVRIINQSNIVQYDGLNTEMNAGGMYRVFNGTNRIISDSPFTVDYQPNGCGQLVDQAATKPQTYAQHQFYLLNDQAITITTSATTTAKPVVRYKLIDLNTDAVVRSGTTTSTSTLPKGFYKLVCEAGDVSIQYSNSFEQISFRFYNHLGQLIGSLAPKGAKQLLDELRTTGTLNTFASAAAVPYLILYEYDLRGRMIAQTEPDAGRTRFAYRNDGKLRFTQNSKQSPPNNKLSFVNYDRTGRVIESGEYTCSASETFQTLSTDSNVLENTSPTGGLGSRQEYTRVSYDLPVHTNISGYEQEFVAGRVSTTASYVNGQVVAQTWFSYDELGRTKWIVKQINPMPAKTIDYTYNELGMTATVCYQQNVAAERFTHYYTYDANRRLLKVETNLAVPTDQASLRSVQGRYSYYLHGPLKRMEVGNDLQGIDYAYTAQGWLKHLNHPTTFNDPVRDGSNNRFLPDLFGQSLDYYGASDYSSRRIPTNALQTNHSPARYDGFIRAASWMVQGSPIRGQSFVYNPLNQLTQAAYGLVVPSAGGLLFTPDANSRYSEEDMLYDPNGNITRMRRKDGSGGYSFNALYDLVPNTNKLNKLRSGADEITTIGQYTYSLTGETVSQTELPRTNSSDRDLTYYPSGKIKDIYIRVPNVGTILSSSYSYDEQGNRISELVYPNPVDQTAYFKSYYLRDGSGNILATYILDSKMGGQLQLREHPIYGASRLGVYRRAYGNQVAEQLYEHYDHLGNTRVVYRRPTTTPYNLSMEVVNVQQEKQDFPDPAGSPGRYDVVRSSNYARNSTWSVRLGRATAMTGPAKTLTLGKGDKVNISAYAFYQQLTTNPPGSGNIVGNGSIGTALVVGAASATTSQPLPPRQEYPSSPNRLNQLLSRLRFGIAIPLAAKSIGKPSESKQMLAGEWAPNAALQYVFTPADGSEPRNGTAIVNHTVNGSPASGVWQQLTLSTGEIDRPGTLEVSMNSYDGERVYFDDLKIEHEIGPIVQENNFYAYGMPMPVISWSRPGFLKERSGYQGMYATYDEETKYNSFLLRQYDARVGRWLSKDPYRQYASPYAGMGNNPVNRIDKNGGFATHFGAFMHRAFFGGNEHGDIYQSGKDWLYNRDAGPETGWVTQKNWSEISNAYNSDAARYAFHDMYAINVGASGGVGMGSGTTLSLVWLTRGPEASIFPNLMSTTGPRIGFDKGGVSATVSTGLHTKGDISDGTFGLGDVENISASSLEDLGADVSLSYGVVTMSGGVGLSKQGDIGWVTVGGGITTPGVGGSVGLTKTTLLAPSSGASTIVNQVVGSVIPTRFMW